MQNSLPYVYKLTHKNTGQFYIGFRCANRSASSTDIYQYQSSSKIVKDIGFENFNVEIVAEFFNKDDAYTFEQSTIFENLSNPLLLNKSCFYDKKRFVNFGHSDETKKRMSKTRKGVPKSKEQVEKMRKTKVGKSKPSGRNKTSDPVAISHIKKRITNFSFDHLEEFINHVKYLSQSMKNSDISKHLNISHGTIIKYLKM